MSKILSLRNSVLIVRILLVSVAIASLVLATGDAISSTKPDSAKQPAKISLVSNAANVPKEGTKLKFGLFTDSKSIQTNEAELGSKVNIIAWFKQWDVSLGSGELNYACSNGYLPVITWESWNGQNSTNKTTYSLADIASGKYNALIRQNIQAVKNVCGNETVIIRFDHEMDTPAGQVGWYPWQGDPQEYIAAWQNVVGISRQIDPNIKWLWSPNRGNAISKQYYPGNKWVDYVGLTLNHGVLETQYQSFPQFYQDNQALIESFNKPVIISETTSAESLGNKAAWVSGMFAFAKTDPKITAVVWFNGSTDYQFDSSQSSLDAFKSSLTNL